MTERMRRQWPVLTAQVEAALLEAGEPELAATLDGLDVVERCSCGDDFCQSFYTEPPPAGPFPAGHRCVPLIPPWPGYLVLDVVHEKIAYVEVLYRPALD